MWSGKRSYNLDEFFWFLQKAKVAKYSYYIQKYGRSGEFLKGEHEAMICKDRGFSFIDRFKMNDPLTGQEMVKYGEEPIFIMNHYGEKVGVCEELQNVHILELLKMGLMAMYQDWGINGIVMYKRDGFDFLIENMVEASMHSGKGKIFKNEELVYQYNYYGGVLYI
jgi:hypothetical protein